MYLLEDKVNQKRNCIPKVIFTDYVQRDARINWFLLLIPFVPMLLVHIKHNSHK